MDTTDFLLLAATGVLGWWIMRENSKPENIKCEQRGKRTLKGYDVPYGALFVAAESQYSLPKFLLVEVARKESNFKCDAYNKSGASGIMQIIPKSHPNVDPWLPADAIPYAAGYLSSLYMQFGSWGEALAAYNWGPKNLKKYGFDRLPLETSDYVGTIQLRLRRQGTVI